MAVKEGGFKKKSKVASEIPTASMADIAFLLLIFFMVSTTFRKEQKRPVTFPKAEATQKSDAKRKNILHVWVEKSGNVFINDRNVPFNQISNVVLPIYRESDRQLVVSIRADRDTPYKYIDQVEQELREANAVRVIFYTDIEQRMTRERR